MNGNFAPSIRSHKHSCDSGHVSRRRQKGPSIGSPVFCFPWLERECPPCPSIRTSTQKNNMRTDKHIKGQANIQYIARCLKPQVSEQKHERKKRITTIPISKIQFCVEVSLGQYFFFVWSRSLSHTNLAGEKILFSPTLFYRNGCS